MQTRRHKVVNHWWVTASLRDPLHGWHWRTFFRNPGNRRQNYDWGGPDWINSTISFARIKLMSKGDIVVAYQAGEGVVGLAQLASRGYQHIEGGNFDTFNLKPAPTIWLRSPVPYPVIRALPGAEDSMEFTRIRRGTVFTIKGRGFNQILHLIWAFNPHLDSAIQQFLHSGRA